MTDPRRSGRDVGPEVDDGPGEGDLGWSTATADEGSARTAAREQGAAGCQVPAGTP